MTTRGSVQAVIDVIEAKRAADGQQGGPGAFAGPNFVVDPNKKLGLGPAGVRPVDSEGACAGAQVKAFYPANRHEVIQARPDVLHVVQMISAFVHRKRTGPDWPEVS